MKDRISKAKLQLMIKSPFLSFICLQITHIIDSSQTTSACTDGKKIIYNENYLAVLLDSQLVGLIAHEVYHIAFQHSTRYKIIPDVDFNIYNIAADLVIDNILLKDNFVVPNVIEDNPKYASMTTEEVYFELIHNVDNLPNQNRSDIIFTNEARLNDVTREVNTIVISATNQAKSSTDTYDSLPKEITNNIKILIHPKISWEKQLNRYFTMLSKDDYTFRSPDMRFMPSVYLPTMHSNSLKNITIAIDTSASISKKIHNAILVECKSVFNKMQPDSMTILDCDYKIHNITKIIKGKKLDMQTIPLKGGSYTDFFPVMEYCKNNNTTVLLYFTDLEAEPILKKHNYRFPIIWVCFTNHPKAPYGKTIYYHPQYED